MYHYNHHIHSESEDSRHYSNSNSDNTSPLFHHGVDPVNLDELPSQFLNNDPSTMLNDSLFDFNSSQWDFLLDAHQQDDTYQQEAILLSDPNFLRQHQLLQDQQRNMQIRMQDDSKEQVSNLTAMLDTTAIVKPTKHKRNSMGRRQQTLSKSTSDTNTDDASKIDHQRRFNELQARFRVNYARKPTTNPSNSSSKLTPKPKSINKPKSPNPSFVNNPPPLSPTTIDAPPVTTTPPAPVNTNNDTSLHLPPPPPPPCSSPTPPPLSLAQHDTPKPKLEFTLTHPAHPPSLLHSPTTLPTHEPLVDTERNRPEDSDDRLSSSFPSRTMPIQIQRMSRPNQNQPFDAESHQRLLDSQLDKVDFDDITVSELKEMLRQRGKPATGKKAVLLQRLQEERDLAKGGGGKSPNRMNFRHSQPLPFSRSINSSEHPSNSRPRSFQGSSPVAIQQNYHQQQQQQQDTLAASPNLLPPSSPGGQLHRSIANMHIGSPPTASRRYSPYSPRLSSSPKPSCSFYSSSVPLSSGEVTSPGHPSRPVQPQTGEANGGMMLSSSYSIANNKPPTTPGRYYNNPKTYKPFTSSALATPDREEDINPFDRYYANQDAPVIKEEEIDSNDMDWSDPVALDMLLQQGTINMNTAQMMGQPLYSDDVVLTNEQIMSLINSQQQATPFEFKIEENSHFNTHYHPH
ncbi:hypothetical protein EDC96DRAFT_508213 [Choanephora cucurbitarum]|nr:hypothetical protein EDC96DRAFT_508213 [Choanephora cucurbitarum]